MICSGDHDLLVPFLGTQAWVRSLNFPVMDAWRAWHVDGQTAGYSAPELLFFFLLNSFGSRLYLNRTNDLFFNI